MFSEQTWLARLIWISLLVGGLWAVVEWRLELAFVALGTLVVSVVPVLAAKWADVRVPPSFIAAVVFFVTATLFLGEVFDFYERFWWWDIAMHASSAVAFGLVGFVLVFIMFQGDRFAAPPIAMAFFAFCFAMTIGALWEIFEYGMDHTFGMNMQKSGLNDTMGDLMVNTIGAAIGAASGFAYLKGQARGGVQQMIDEFVQRNPKLFKRRRR